MSFTFKNIKNLDFVRQLESSNTWITSTSDLDVSLKHYLPCMAIKKRLSEHNITYHRQVRTWRHPTIFTNNRELQAYAYHIQCIFVDDVSFHHLPCLPLCWYLSLHVMYTFHRSHIVIPSFPSSASSHPLSMCLPTML